MKVQRVVLVAALLCAAFSVPASAQTIPTDAIAIVTDPETLEREIPAGTGTFVAYVVFLNPDPGLRSVGAAQFGLELDPGLSLVAATTDGLLLEPEPLEFVIAYPDCLSEPLGNSFVLAQLFIDRDGSEAPGAGVRLAPLASMGLPIEATRCVSHTIFAPLDFGGISVAPDTPTVAEFITDPEYPVEGRPYSVHWECVGGGDWTLDGVPVSTRGTLEFDAVASRVHVLAESAAGITRELTIDVIREPRVLYLEYSPDEGPGQVRVRWSVAGAAGVQVTGLGWMVPSGATSVDVAQLPVFEITATNEWGSLWDSIELVEPAGPPVIDAFVLSPPDFEWGQTVWVSYEVRGASEVRIDPQVGRVPIGSGAIQVMPHDPQTWTLTASNSQGTVIAEVVALPGPPRIDSVELLTEGFRPGDPIDIAYEVLGAEQAWFVEGQPVPLPAGTATFVAPEAVEVWQFTAENAAGIVTQDVTIAPSPPTLFLSGDDTFGRGEPVDLNWNVWWATSLTLLPDSIPLPPTDGDGTIRVYPETATEYSIVASNLGGTTTKSFLVNEALAIYDFSVDPTEATGEVPVTFSWDTGGAERLEIWKSGAKVHGITIPSPPPSADSLTLTLDAPLIGPVQLVAFGPTGQVESDPIELSIMPWENLIHHFYADPPVFDTGPATTRLNWQLAGTMPASIEPGGIQVGSSGSIIASVSESMKYWVLHAQYLSYTDTDTAWAAIDPRGSFVIDPVATDPGSEVLLHYEAPGADRAIILPDIGEVPVTGGEPIAVTVDELSTFEFHAWYDGEREVIERAVGIAPLEIERFEFSENWLDADQPAELAWSVRGAENVSIVGPNASQWVVGSEGVLEVAPGSYGIWQIQASQAEQTEQRSIKLNPTYEPPGVAVLLPTIALPGEAVSLHWDIPDAIQVEFLDHGRQWGETGELEFTAGSASQAIEFAAAIRVGRDPLEWHFYSVPLRVDVPGQPPTLHLSSDPATISGEPALLQGGAGGGSSFLEFYVVGQDILGPIEALSFSLDLPDWLEVESVEPLGEPELVPSGPDLAFRLRMCANEEPYSGELARVRVRVVGTPPPDAEAVVSILQEPAPRWHPCNELLEFGFTLPALPIEVGMPVLLRVTPVSVDDSPPLAEVARTRLVGARPNPFNPRTTIHWELAEAGPVNVAIYDLAGRRLREWTLPRQPRGPGQMIWNGTDRRGARAASGVYLVRFQADGVVETKRVTLLK